MVLHLVERVVELKPGGCELRKACDSGEARGKAREVLKLAARTVEQPAEVFNAIACVAGLIAEILYPVGGVLFGVGKSLCSRRGLFLGVLELVMRLAGIVGGGLGPGLRLKKLLFGTLRGGAALLTCCRKLLRGRFQRLICGFLDRKSVV